MVWLLENSQKASEADKDQEIRTKKVQHSIAAIIPADHIGHVMIRHEQNGAGEAIDASLCSAQMTYHSMKVCINVNCDRGASQWLMQRLPFCCIRHHDGMVGNGTQPVVRMFSHHFGLKVGYKSA